MSHALLLSILLVWNLLWCSLASEPFVDAEEDGKGNVKLLDTPRMWQYWQEDVDRAIAKELRGESPGGGIESWSNQWQRVIRANSDRENAQKYIDYIVERRKQVGLPSLE
ncbi:MAG: hypothetical protein ACWA5Q_00080 [bacterium]